MKPFKTFGGFVLSASALLLVTSCSKSLDQTKGENEVSLLSHEGCGNCGDRIHLNMSNTNPGSNYFYVGDRSDVSGHQNFVGSDFDDDQYFTVTASGGTPYTMDERLGVDGGAESAFNMRAINAAGSESLSFELSACMSDYKMSGFKVTLTGNSTGVIELYDGMTLVETVPYSNSTGGNFFVSHWESFVIDHDWINYFTKVTFKPTTGWINVRGFQANKLNGKPTTEFYLVNMVGAVYMRNDNPTMSRYINPGPHPSGLDVPATRQYKAADPSGDYTGGTHEWLAISAMGGSLYFNGASGQMRLGVMGSGGYPGAIEMGESIVVEPGADFPTTHFSAFEFREATGGGQMLKVDLYDGATWVGGGMTSGIDQNYNLFYANDDKPFNKVVISGTVSGSSLASVGRPGSFVMSAFPGCPSGGGE